MCATGGIAGSSISPSRAPKCMSRPGLPSRCAGPGVRASSRPANAYTPRTAINTVSMNSVLCCAGPASGTSQPGPISATGLHCSTPWPDAETAVNDLRELHSIGPGHDNPAVGGDLRSRYARIRACSVNLVKPLSEEDCCEQSMPDASPSKWHLCHTSWLFETFVLEKYSESFAPYLPAFR